MALSGIGEKGDGKDNYSGNGETGVKVGEIWGLFKNQVMENRLCVCLELGKEIGRKMALKMGKIYNT